ncbi:MAG: DUF308 domain-containing protein [Actinomycetia bacterium]|nr:DUF308 domain-containing protein [Actinomycetes bacterium]
MTDVEVYDDLAELKKGWWLLALLGLLSIGFGALLIFWPGRTIAVVTTIFGLFMVVSGVIRFFVAVFDSRSEARWLMLLSGIVGVVLGVIVMKNPEATIQVIVVIAALFWIISGMVDLFRGLTHGDLPDRGVRIGFGALATLMGVVVLVWPEITVGAFAILMGIYTVLFGVLELLAAFQIKNA